MGFYQNQIDKALKKSTIVDTSLHPCIVMFSDCHRGNGTWSDSFLNNKTLYTAALNYYYNRDFTYIELGDGDELWENRSFQDIYQIHSDVFQQLLKFQLENRLFMLYGNHDKIKSFSNFYTANGQFHPPCYSSLIIKGQPGCKDLHLIHGHQVDPINNQFWKIARWLVRYVWRPLELAGVKDPTSAAKNYSKKKTVETRLNNWVKKKDHSLVAGHTHRPALPLGTGSGYYNTGSCVHPNTITCLELVYGYMTLVKWTTCADDSMHLYVCRQTISGPRQV